MRRITPGLLIGGAWGLLLVAVGARGRLRSRYWAWRKQTAFGPGSPESRLRFILEFGDWARRMRRFER